MHIVYGFHETQFGTCCIAIAQQSVCHLSFVNERNVELVVQQLASEWPKVQLQRNEAETKSFVDTIFAKKVGKNTPNFTLRGTKFQQLVWQKLCEIPVGQTRSYEQVATMLGKPTAVRAVASAIAKNRIAYLIPCHRVIRKSGKIHKYRWGSELKKTILMYELSFSNGW